jgi:hypothetical protein
MSAVGANKPVLPGNATAGLAVLVRSGKTSSGMSTNLLAERRTVPMTAGFRNKRLRT